MQPNVNEQLAMLTALQKAVKAKLDEVRAEADESMLESYEDDGVVKKALKVGGVKVGDYIVVLTSDEWNVTDEDALEDFALCNGLAETHMAIKPECMPAAVKIIESVDPFLLSEEARMSPDWKKYLTNSGGAPPSWTRARRCRASSRCLPASSARRCGGASPRTSCPRCRSWAA